MSMKLRTTKSKVKKIHLDRTPIFNDRRTSVIMDLAYEGFTHDTIRRSIRGVTIGQVGYRLMRLGVSTSKVRRGQGEEAKDRINKVMAEHGFAARKPQLRKRESA